MGPVTNPTARVLASWLCALWGPHEGARGGRLLPGCGASGVRRSPSPDCPPSGRAAGAHYPLAVGAGGCGRGDPSPAPQHPLLRAGFARCGGGLRLPGGGASCLGVGRPGSGALPPPTACHLGGLPGPTTHWLWVWGVPVWRPVTNPPARALASWLCALWGRHEGARGGALPAWVWGVRGRALSQPRLPALWAGCRGPLPTGCGCGGARAWGPVTNPTAHALASWLCALSGRHDGARGGRLLPGCGASGVGRSPTHDCPPSGRASGLLCLCVPCLAGSGGPASRACFGAPHLSFGLSCFALCLFGPLQAGVALFVVGVRFFFFVAFPLLPLAAPPLCPALRIFRPRVPWALASGPPSPPPFFFPSPPSVRPVVSCFACFPAWGALGLAVSCGAVLPCGAVLWCPVFFFLFFSLLVALVSCCSPVGSGVRAGSGSFLFLCSACAVLCWCACAVALCSVLSCSRGAGWCFVLLPVVFVCLLMRLAVLCCLLVGPGGSWCRVSLACCVVSLGAVLRRVAARSAAWRCVVVRCVVSFCCVWCCRALCCVLGRCPSSWGPVPSGAVFCLVPPRCLCFAVVCRCVVLFAVVLCAVCALGCRVVRFLSSPPCAVLLCGPLSLGALLPCAVPCGAVLPRGAVVSCPAALLGFFLAWVWLYLLEKPLQNFVKHFFPLFLGFENKIKLYTTQHTRVQQDHVRCCALRATRRS